MKTAIAWGAAGFAFASALAWFWAARAHGFIPTGKEPPTPEAKQMWLLHGLIAASRASSRRIRWGAALSGFAAVLTGVSLVL